MKFVYLQENGQKRSPQYRIRETQLRWFGHMQRRLWKAPLGKNDEIVIYGTRRTRGRPKRTRAIQMDMWILNLTMEVPLTELIR